MLLKPLGYVGARGLDLRAIRDDVRHRILRELTGQSLTGELLANHGVQEIHVALVFPVLNKSGRFAVDHDLVTVPLFIFDYCIVLAHIASVPLGDCHDKRQTQHDTEVSMRPVSLGE